MITAATQTLSCIPVVAGRQRGFQPLVWGTYDITYDNSDNLFVAGFGKVLRP